MNYLLLLGAGFSRNWGGWLASEVFDYLLGCQEIRQDDHLKSHLMRHQRTGFETALAELQDAWTDELQKRQSSPPYFSHPKAYLDKFQSALEQMFRDMNRAFSELSDFEFQNDKKFMVRAFLARFDAIFTLNQDLLLETHYRQPNSLFAFGGKWDGWQIPGMKEVSYLSAQGSITPIQYPVKKWVPENSGQFKVTNRQQPYFKLHGSSEWRDGTDREMLVMGGNKSHAIQSREVLNWYHREFSSRLSMPDTRLMIIGYGFGDEHINYAITEAAKKGGLQIFIIDPSGVDTISKTNLTFVRPHNIYVPNHLENVLLPVVMGASKRSLREIFGQNSFAEFNQVMRFFN